MFEDVLLSRADIQEGRDGLSRIIANPHFRKLINDYTLDDEAKKRIENLQYTNEGAFYSKMNNYTLEPAGVLSKHILKSDDDSIKCFLLIFCISTAHLLFAERIQGYLDRGYSNHRYSNYRYNFQRLDLSSAHLTSDLVRDVIDVESIMAHSFPQITKTVENDEDRNYHFVNSEYGGLCLSISLLALSAGYHFVNDIKVVPDELLERGVDLPFVLSDAMYISTITGEDYYDVLGNIFYANGLKGRFDDVIAMCRKNKALEELASERRKLENLLSENEEKRRVQLTAGEIITEYYGKGVSKEDIEARVKKCNSPEYRKLLYELESINKARLSFLSPIHMTGLANIDEEEIANHFGVIFSQKEFSRISTIEDLIDTIVLHRRFRNHFFSSTIRKIPLDFEVDESFDLETMTREVEKMYGITVERDSITNAEDLRKYISENDSIYNIIVSTLVEKLGVSPEEVTPDSNLTKDLGADSLDTVELIMDAEKAFGVTIPEEEAQKISTVEDIYKVVMAKK